MSKEFAFRQDFSNDSKEGADGRTSDSEADSGGELSQDTGFDLNTRARNGADPINTKTDNSNELAKDNGLDLNIKKVDVSRLHDVGIAPPPEGEPLPYGFYGSGGRTDTKYPNRAIGIREQAEGVPHSGMKIDAVMQTRNANREANSHYDKPLIDPFPEGTGNEGDRTYAFGAVSDGTATVTRSFNNGDSPKYGHFSTMENIPSTMSADDYQNRFALRQKEPPVGVADYKPAEGTRFIVGDTAPQSIDTNDDPENPNSTEQDPKVLDGGGAQLFDTTKKDDFLESPPEPTNVRYFGSNGDPGPPPGGSGSPEGFGLLHENGERGGLSPDDKKETELSTEYSPEDKTTYETMAEFGDDPSYATEGEEIPTSTRESDEAPPKTRIGRDAMYSTSTEEAEEETLQPLEYSPEDEAACDLHDDTANAEESEISEPPTEYSPEDESAIEQADDFSDDPAYAEGAYDFPADANTIDGITIENIKNYETPAADEQPADNETEVTDEQPADTEAEDAMNDDKPPEDDYSDLGDLNNPDGSEDGEANDDADALASDGNSKKPDDDYADGGDLGETDDPEKPKEETDAESGTTNDDDDAYADWGDLGDTGDLEKPEEETDEEDDTKKDDDDAYASWGDLGDTGDLEKPEEETDEVGGTTNDDDDAYADWGDLGDIDDTEKPDNLINDENVITNDDDYSDWGDLGDIDDTDKPL